MPRTAARPPAPRSDSDASGHPLEIVSAPELAPVLPLHTPTRPKRTPDAKRRQDTDRKARNYLWYGDNLEWLSDRDAFPSESVDLVYLDPPFNSDRAYNVLFRAPGGAGAAAQIQAFDDTWTWSDDTSAALREFCRIGPPSVSALVSALHEALGETNITAYLVMMAPRLVELHRVMKRTASLFLHCDPTASHYLKIVLDAIFGKERFLNEIVWRRTASKGQANQRLARNHDIILGYQKSEDAKWNADAAYFAYDTHRLDAKTASKYALTDDGGRLYQLTSLLNPNPDRPNLTYEFLGVRRVWRWSKDRMEEAYRAGLIVQTKPGAVPRFKRYLDEQRGKPLTDVWTDIDPLNSQAKERLGYPTQKPLSLLDRIIRLTTDKDDIVLDPFCGCGTAVAAAEALGRRWIGIDITSFAIDVIEQRLDQEFEAADFRVNGLPETLEDAEDLFKRSPHQFQWWAAGRIKAQPRDGRKKGADEGVDGILHFFDDNTNRPKTCIVSVKGGQNVGPEAVRDLAGTVAAKKAQMGVLITMIDPKPSMKQAAREAQVYFSALGRDFPKIQIVTIADILAQRMPAIPGEDWQRRPGRRIPAQAATQQPLIGAD